MARPTRAFIQPLVLFRVGLQKGNDLYLGEPPKIFIYFLSDGPIKLARPQKKKKKKKTTREAPHLIK
jgi:hypothetical protein